MISIYLPPSLHLSLAVVLRFMSPVSLLQLSCNTHLHSVGEVITLAYTSVSEEVMRGDRRKETGGRPTWPQPGAFAWTLTPRFTADP